jgi:transcriptional regulator with XRE-family HTH domain
MTVAARKLFAGPRVRRLRAARGLTQTRMAEALGVSVSYLNLIEANQRPVTASVLLKLSDLFDVDARALAADDDEALAGAVADALAADGIGRREARDFVESHPAIARALLTRRAAPAEGDDPTAVVRAHILSRNNHFPALEAHAEALADELRLAGGPLGAAIGERLRVRHALSVRVLPVEVMPGALMRLDWHARQVQLSESLDGASRTFRRRCS